MASCFITLVERPNFLETTSPMSWSRPLAARKSLIFFSCISESGASFLVGFCACKLVGRNVSNAKTASAARRLAIIILLLNCVARRRLMHARWIIAARSIHLQREHAAGTGEEAPGLIRADFDFVAARRSAPGLERIFVFAGGKI